MKFEDLYFGVPELLSSSRSINLTDSIFLKMSNSEQTLEQHAHQSSETRSEPTREISNFLKTRVLSRSFLKRVCFDDLSNVNFEMEFVSVFEEFFEEFFKELNFKVSEYFQLLLSRPVRKDFCSYQAWYATKNRNLQEIEDLRKTFDFQTRTLIDENNTSKLEQSLPERAEEIVRSVKFLTQNVMQEACSLAVILSDSNVDQSQTDLNKTNKTNKTGEIKVPTLIPDSESSLGYFPCFFSLKYPDIDELRDRFWICSSQLNLDYIEKALAAIALGRLQQLSYRIKLMNDRLDEIYISEL